MDKRLLAVAVQLLVLTSVQCAFSRPAVSKGTRAIADQSDESATDVTPAVITPATQTYVLATTTPSIDGYRVKEYKGFVRGVMVRQPTVGQGLAANLERIVGGKVGAYLAMCDTGRQQAYDLCVEHARLLGANAVLGMAYDSTAFEHGDDLEVEIVCYGTAVVIEPINKSSK
jgi:uncharacterized protein YbjQ (UPF0145 family)